MHWSDDTVDITCISGKILLQQVGVDRLPIKSQNSKILSGLQYPLGNAEDEDHAEAASSHQLNVRHV